MVERIKENLIFVFCTPSNHPDILSLTRLCTSTLIQGSFHTRYAGLEKGGFHDSVMNTSFPNLTTPFSTNTSDKARGPQANGCLSAANLQLFQLLSVRGRFPALAGLIFAAVFQHCAAEIPASPVFVLHISSITSFCAWSARSARWAESMCCETGRRLIADYRFILTCYCSKFLSTWSQ